MTVLSASVGFLLWMAYNLLVQGEYYVPPSPVA